jgi:hypothetical protein
MGRWIDQATFGLMIVGVGGLILILLTLALG